MDLMVSKRTAFRLGEHNSTALESVHTGCLGSGVSAPVQCSKHTAKVKAVRSLTLKTLTPLRRRSFRTFSDG